MYRWLTLFFYLLSSALLPAQDRPAVNVTVDRDSISIGERMTYTVTVEAPESMTLIGDPTTDFRDFEVTQIKRFDPVVAAGRRTDRFEYTITTFNIDTFEIPAPGAFVLSGRDTVSLVGRTVTIRVTSVLDTAAADIRPEKPIVRAEVRWWLIGLLFVLLLLVVGGSLFFVVWYIRRRRALNRKTENLRPLVVKSPEELAREELEALRARRLPETGRIKEFHVDVSAIIRQYIERRSGVMALEMPTSDLVAACRHTARLDENYISMLRRFLEVCDLVKFAKYPSSPGECDEVMEHAFSLLVLGMNVSAAVERRLESYGQHR